MSAGEWFAAFTATRVYRIIYRLWSVLLMARAAIAVAALVLVLLDALITQAHAEPTAKRPMSASERAYTLALMCVAVAANDQKDADYQRSLDAVRKMAKQQGYSDNRLSQDIWTMTNVIGDSLHKDPKAIDEKRELCRRLSLAS